MRGGEGKLLSTRGDDYSSVITVVGIAAMEATRRPAWPSRAFDSNVEIQEPAAPPRLSFLSLSLSLSFSFSSSLATE